MSVSEKKQGLLVVVSGPAGSGKGTVIGELMRDENSCFSVSATTRAPRPGEINGVNYHFLTREEFTSRIAAGDLLEYTEYCGNFYGTLKKQTEEVLATGKNLFLEIEVEGAANVKAQYPDAVAIMLLPPSFEIQEARLRGRGTETEESITARLARAHQEVRQIEHYDYVVFNYDGKANEAVEDIRAILRAERATIRRNNDVPTRYFEH